MIYIDLHDHIDFMSQATKFLHLQQKASKTVQILQGQPVVHQIHVAGERPEFSNLMIEVFPRVYM